MTRVSRLVKKISFDTWEVITGTREFLKSLFPWYQWLFYGGLFLFAGSLLMQDAGFTFSPTTKILVLLGTSAMVAAGVIGGCVNWGIAIGEKRARDGH